MDEDDFNLDQYVAEQDRYGDDITSLFDEDDARDGDARDELW